MKISERIAQKLLNSSTSRTYEEIIDEELAQIHSLTESIALTSQQCHIREKAINILREFDN